MRARELTHGPPRMVVVVLDKDEEVSDGLLAAARAEGFTGAAFTAIGAFSRATLGWFDRSRQDYLRIDIDEQVEVLSLAGNVAIADGEISVHAHGVVGRRDGTAFGGHLLSATVWPTLEVVFTEMPTHLCRRYDEETGLTLLDP